MNLLFPSPELHCNSVPLPNGIYGYHSHFTSFGSISLALTTSRGTLTVISFSIIFLCSPFRYIFRAKHHNTAKTLLTVIPTFSAKFIVGNAVSIIQNQRTLLFLFLAHSWHINPPFRLKIKKTGKIH